MSLWRTSALHQKYQRPPILVRSAVFTVRILLTYFNNSVIIWFSGQKTWQNFSIRSHLFFHPEFDSDREMCVNYLPYWCLVSSCNSSSWWLGFVFILEKLLDTLAEINQKLLKIVKMYFIQNLSTFIYLVTFYLKTKM